MEDSQEKDYSFLFPILYDALVYERKFKSDYLERQIYERSLKSERSIVKLIENKSDLSKLSRRKAKSYEHNRQTKRRQRVGQSFLKSRKVIHKEEAIQVGSKKLNLGRRHRGRLDYSESFEARRI